MSSVPDAGTTTTARLERRAALAESLSAVAGAMDRLDAELLAATGSTGTGHSARALRASALPAQCPAKPSERSEGER